MIIKELMEERKWLIRNHWDFVLHRFTAPSYKEAEIIADRWASENIERLGKSKKYFLSQDNLTNDY